MANFVAMGTTFGPFTGAFTGVTPADGTYYSEGGDFGDAPYACEPVFEEEDVTFADVNGTGGRNRGFRFRPIIANLIFCGTVSGVHTSTKTFLDACRTIDTTIPRANVSLPDGATFPGCKLRAVSSQRWKNISSGKVIFLMSCTFHQLSLSN